jgi:DNA-binding MarR family transcriptional regulator
VNDGQASRLAAALERLFITLVRERGRLAGELYGNLSLTERHALAIVNDESELRLGLLARHMATTEATASRTVESLVSAGLLERIPDSADRRAIRITATPAGRRLVVDRRRQLSRDLDTALSDMSGDDKERLIELLDQVETVLGPSSRRGQSARTPSLPEP